MIMETKPLFNSPLFKDIMVMPLNRRNYYALSHVITALNLGEEEDVMDKYCEDPISRIVGNNYITERDFVRLILVSPRSEMMKFKLHLFDNVIPNLEVDIIGVNDNMIINTCGRDIFDYCFGQRRLDVFERDGGVWLKHEYSRFRKIFPSSDTNVTRARKKFEDGLCKLLEHSRYKYDEQYIKGVRFLRILSDE